MKTHTRLASLITFGAILGFMLAATSCSISPATQAKIDQANTKYQETTGLTPMQTGTLLGKWWTELQATRELNKLAKSQSLPLSQSAIPLGPIQATQASPLMDYTSAKAVLEGIHPQASAAPPLPVSEPPSLPPAKASPVRRPDAHHPLQIASN